MKNVHGTTLRKFVIFLLDRSSQVVNQNPDRSGPFRTPHDGRKRPPCASFPLFFPIGRKRAPSEALFPRKSSEYLSAHPRTHTHLRAALLHQMKIRENAKRKYCRTHFPIFAPKRADKWQPWKCVRVHQPRPFCKPVKLTNYTTS